MNNGWGLLKTEYVVCTKPFLVLRNALASLEEDLFWLHNNMICNSIWNSMTEENELHVLKGKGPLGDVMFTMPWVSGVHNGGKFVNPPCWRRYSKASNLFRLQSPLNKVPVTKDQETGTVLWEYFFKYFVCAGFVFESFLERMLFWMATSLKRPAVCLKSLQDFYN